MKAPWCITGKSTSTSFDWLLVLQLSGNNQVQIFNITRYGKNAAAIFIHTILAARPKKKTRTRVQVIKLRSFTNLSSRFISRYLLRFAKQNNWKKPIPEWQNFRWLKAEKTALFDSIAPWKFLFFITQFSGGETEKVGGASLTLSLV